MSSLKAFEEATLWRPSLRPVKTAEEPKTNDEPASPVEEPNTCESDDTHITNGASCIPCAPSIMSPQYRTDNFMMYGFKVALCSRPGRHRWDDCPFAHPTENARRRDPRVFSYSCHECPSYRYVATFLQRFLHLKLLHLSIPYSCSHILVPTM